MTNSGGKKAKMAARAAEEERLAARLGITLEELADRNVPTAGLEENGEKCFDYGTRSFSVTLCAIAPGAKFEVFELEEQKPKKKMKSLPRPRRTDDLVKAEAAQEEFKKMKKGLNAVVKAQKRRMELALMTGRCWSVNAWMELFGKHPIMRPLSFALIWGIYRDGQLLQSFRHRRDGLFYDVWGEEFLLPEDARIGFVFPTELTKEEKKAWQEQLWRDDIREQPIGQLELKTYTVHKQEEKKKVLARCKGKFFLDEIFGDRLEKFGWHCGCSVDEHDFYDIYYREDKDAGLCVELHTSGNTPWDNMEIELYGARFFRSGTFDWKTHLYDEKDKEKAIALKDIPARYFSEVVRQIMEAGEDSYLWEKE